MNYFIDFLIGGLLMNAMPHFVFGISKVTFLGMFGFSSVGNILYAILQFSLCIILYHFQFGLSNQLQNGLFTGAISVLILYFLLGKTVLNLFNKRGN